MKNYPFYISLILVLTLVSCKKEEAPKPKVIYQDPSKVKTEVPEDTSQIEIADLPINMDGTNYLIFPIGTISSDKKGIKSSYDSNTGYTVSNYGEYQITGYLQNLKFQEIGQDTIYALTEKNVLIETATYLKGIADKAKKQLMVFTLADLDTNKDNKVNNSDIKSLYLSDISGKNFTKISTDFQELIDWNIIESRNRLYFRAIEDTNKNGAFDKEDTLHYYYVNLLDKEWKAIEINPLP
ncbi:hypothetical protein [Flavobacterium sp. UBA7682]|uniref:hypothetical protein n=1 Tax=Flavobacterium sp. UBA7682 TaxID=1946560 RepID=UPI0025C57C60|nr:hypothetical protein [Flavobacterium sp. UBA7682]